MRSSYRQHRQFDQTSSALSYVYVTLLCRACKEDGKIQIKVALFFNNWLCHEFPAMQPEPEACWYFQDDKKFELHACHPSTVEQLERHYKQNEGRDIQHHKFEMDAPFLIKFEGKLVQSTWIFEAVSISPTSAAHRALISTTTIAFIILLCNQQSPLFKY
jgi:hypothetical protein